MFACCVGTTLFGNGLPRLDSGARQENEFDGDLQIFFGRYSLHRVTRPRGNAERHTLILGYAKEPNLIGRAERTKKLFGRLADVHRRQRDEAPERTDTLSD